MKKDEQVIELKMEGEITDAHHERLAELLIDLAEADEAQKAVTHTPAPIHPPTQPPQ